MKKQHLILLGVGILGYVLWKRSQTETTSEFSNVDGKKKKRRNVRTHIGSKGQLGI